MSLLLGKFQQWYHLARRLVVWASCKWRDWLVSLYSAWQFLLYSAKYLSCGNDLLTVMRLYVISLRLIKAAGKVIYDYLLVQPGHIRLAIMQLIDFAWTFNHTLGNFQYTSLSAVSIHMIKTWWSWSNFLHSTVARTYVYNPGECQTIGSAPDIHNLQYLSYDAISFCI